MKKCRLSSQWSGLWRRPVSIKFSVVIEPIAACPDGRKEHHLYKLELLERDETWSSRVMVYDQATLHRLPVGVGGSLRVRGRELLRNRAGGPVHDWCKVGMLDDKNVLGK